MNRVPNFSFTGDPVSQALAARMAQQHMQSQAAQNSALYGAQAQYGAAREQAQAMRDSTLYQQPGRFAEVMGGLYDSYGRNSAGALGNYLSPYSQAAQGQMAGQAALGRGIGELYGSGVGAMGGLGQSAMAGLANMGSNMFDSATRANAAIPGALASVYGSAAGARANVAGNALGAASARDQAALNATGLIASSANQARAASDAARFNASGNIGAAQAAALANNSIAAANGLGQMGVANYNLQGQLGNAFAGVAAAQQAALGNAAAAQQAAGPQYARANLLAGILPGLLDTVRSGFALPAGASPGGTVGFNASGPEGMIASGSGPGVSAPTVAARPLAPITMGPLGSFAPPALPSFGGGLQETRSLIDSLLDRNDRPESQANLIRGNMTSEFAANRDAIRNSGALQGLQAGSDYAPDYSQIQAIMGATNYDPARLMSQADAGMGDAMDRIQGSGQNNLGAIGDMLSRGAGQMQGLMDSAYGRIGGMLADGADGIGGFGNRIDAGFNRFANDAGGAYGGVSGGLEGRFDQTYGGMSDLWRNSLGRSPLFASPSDLAREEIAARRMREQAAVEDRLARQQRIARERIGQYGPGYGAVTV